MIILIHAFGLVLVTLKLIGVLDLPWAVVVLPNVLAVGLTGLAIVVGWVLLTDFDRQKHKWLWRLFQ